MIKGIILFLIIIGAVMFMVGGSTETIVVSSSPVEYAHLYGIADEEQSLLVVGDFQAIDFNFNIGDVHNFTPQDINCIIVQDGGHYFATMEAHFQDTSANPTSQIALIITKNGLEVSGSYSEMDVTKKDADIEITTFAYIETVVNDVLCMEWTADDSQVMLTNHGSYADQPVVAKGFINWVHAN